MKVRFHPATRSELRQAWLWYDERSPVAAAAFAREVDAAVSRIAAAPLRYPAAEHGTRRAVLPHFPYAVFFRLEQQEITVVAVTHHKRLPNYWSSR